MEVTVAAKSVLIVGEDPALIDFDAPGALKDMSAERVMSGLNGSVERLRIAGHHQHMRGAGGTEARIAAMRAPLVVLDDRACALSGGDPAPPFQGAAVRTPGADDAIVLCRRTAQRPRPASDERLVFDVTLSSDGQFGRYDFVV